MSDDQQEASGPSEPAQEKKPAGRGWGIFFLRWLVGLSLLFGGIWVIPHRWCNRHADAWYDGDLETQQKLATSVERWLNGEHGQPESMATLYEGEWLFAAYAMAGIAFGQMAIEHPELAERNAQSIETCIEKILKPLVQRFDKEAWGRGALDVVKSIDAIEAIDRKPGHAAYLGYFNLLLSFHRMFKPDSKYAALNDAITDALVFHLGQSRILLLESYPEEVYPVDNCAVIASVALFDKATKSEDHQKMIKYWIAKCESDWIDPKTGLLYHSVKYSTGKPDDEGRGSTTCLASYLLSFADETLSRKLYEAVDRKLADSLLGFGAIRESPGSLKISRGKLDSGPIVFGFSVSATGFGIAGSRIHGDRDGYRRIYATSYLFGTPDDRGNEMTYVAGGSLGNALMLAMLTAQPVKNFEQARSKP
ncbi:MAG: hypothetical protein N2C12_10605 [Planctomycetales bacterium]